MRKEKKLKMAECPGASSHPVPAAGPDFSFLLVLGKLQEVDEPHVEEGLWVPSLASHSSFLGTRFPSRPLVSVFFSS